MTDKIIERASFITDEHLEFLDDLRESAVVNMFGAGPYLDEQFPELADDDVRSYRSSEKARAILSYWMATFGERHPQAN